MSALLGLSRLIDSMNERLSRIANWLVLLSCLISAGNAMSRYAISVSSNAWLEIQWYMFGAMVMLGASYTLNRNEHVRVDLIYGHVSTRAQLWIDILGGILFLLPATIIIGWLSWPMFINSWRIDEMSVNAGGLLRWPIKIFVPLGFLLLTLQGFSEIIKRVGALTGHCAPPRHYEKPLQ
ncbi:MAG: TRAP transporter small permease subunit [Betaproteobacteria bacterium]|nr:TRAP transporter small permease subunit [Betaproteobacteria bacterium]